jgi:hypothetical protein
MTAAKPTSEVVTALAARGELTNAEIATATGLGRSTVGKTLAALERAGMARRSPGGRGGGRRLPDRWSVGSSDEPSHQAPPAGGCVRDSSTGSSSTSSTPMARARRWGQPRWPRP